ncbi:RNA polymerase sigma factor [Flagellimonas sp.]|uniref:RNA polymerase sigma factor n=1 Tax=Flagellimonas sp. TaxID=2058762 RepID=UPI003B5CE20D
MSTDRDQQLIEHVLEGDVNAFAQLVEKYKHMVYTVAFRMVKQHEDAEEIAQDVFLSAHKNLKKFKRKSKFSTWLYRIVYNKSLDYLKVNRKITVTTLDSLDLNTVMIENDIIKGIELNERGIAVKEALRELSPQDNALMVFFYFEELSLKEISKITGIKENAIKVRLYRSRQRLAEVLSKKLTPETIKCYGKR